MKKMSVDRVVHPNPFAALVGYDDAVAETVRLTESRPELDEQEHRIINEQLAFIVEHIKEEPEVSIKYFVPDERKSGGAIVEVCGKVKKVSAADGIIVMADGCKVQIIGIVEISYTNC